MLAKAQLFERMAIVGIGLIGSSIAWATLRSGLAGTVLAYDASAHVRQRARELGLAHFVPETIAEAVGEADLVVLCVPVGAMAAAAAAVAPHLKPGAIVSDVGSVKASVIAAVTPLLPDGVFFVPVHPVAGTEFSGPDAGFAELFETRWCLITPCETSSEAAIERVGDLWRGFGAKVDTMTPEHHDMVLAITSHVPHLIAYSIVGTAAHLEEVTNSDVIKFSANGFRDFTRIASSDPVMWRDVFLNNREPLLEMLARYSEDLSALQRLVRWGDSEGLFQLLARTSTIRRSLAAQGPPRPSSAPREASDLGANRDGIEESPLRAGLPRSTANRNGHSHPTQSHIST